MVTMRSEDQVGEHDRDTLPGAPRSEGVPTGVYVSPSITGEDEGVPQTGSPGARVVDESTGASPARATEGPSWGDVVIGVAKTIDARLREQLAFHPYRSLAIAAAAGFAIRNAKAARAVALLGSRVALDALSLSAAKRAA